MSILDQWQDRWNFAVYNNEQRFQTQLVTKRRFFNNVINMPLKRIQNRMLRPDVPTTGFDAAAFSFVDDVFITSGAGQVIRSFVFAYGNNKDFRDIHNTSRALESFSMAVESFDTSPLSLGEEIAAGRSDVMYDLVNHSEEASDLLDKFVHGKLPQSPSNIAKLERHLHALAKVCDEKAEVMKAAQGVRKPEQRADETQERISDYIRDVIRADKITTAREAQILSGFVSALLVDAAKPIGTEAYVAQEDVFMQPKEAVKFSAFVAEQLKQRGFGTNTSLDNEEQLPFADLPEGALIKEERDAEGKVVSRRKASEAELLSLANALHSQLRKELGSKVETMLEFVDKNFDKVEQSIARSQEDPTPEAMPIWNRAPNPQAAQEHQADKWQEKRSLSPFKLLGEVDNTIRTSVRHMFRPEARHDSNKLFGRALAGVIVSYPVKIFNEAAKSFLRDGNGYEILKDGIKTGTLKGQLIDREDLKNNFQSNNFRSLTTPLASSVATVMSQELYHLPKGLALEAAGRADSVLNGALRSGHRHAPQVAGRMKALDGEHPALEALLQHPDYKDTIPAIMAKPGEERSEADYKLLGEYYRDLSDICISTAEEALSPYGVGITPEKIDGMDDVVARVLRRSVENVPDAMVALAFVESFLSVSAEKTSAMDYIDPRQILIKYNDMHRLGEFIDNQAKAAGLVMATCKKPGKGKPGELLEKNPKTGELEPVSPETLVRFANVVTAELKHYVNLDALLMAAKGKHKDEYIKPVEKKLFKLDKEEKQEEKTKDEIAKELTSPWQGKVSRKSKGLVGTIRDDIANPEVQHEIRKLHGRTLGESTSSCVSSIFSNSLQHNEGILSRAGIFSAIYGPIVYPIVYSKGLVWAKEAINETFLHKGAIAAEADITQSLVKGALKASGQIDTQLRDKLVYDNRLNADLMQLQGKDEFQDIPRISAKPRDLRTDKDNELMQRFCDEIGEKMIVSSTQIFTTQEGEGTRRSVSQVLETALEKPVTSLQDATITLGFLNSVIDKNVDTMKALRFVKPEDKTMSRGQLRELTDFMNDQAKLAGFAVHGVPVKGKNGNEFTILGNDETLKEGEMIQWNQQTKQYERPAPESIIRFTNVSVGKFRDLTEKRLKDKGVGSLVERYQREAKNEVFSRL